GARVECDRPDLTIITSDGQNTGYGIVRSISLDGNRSFQGKVSSDKGRSEGLLEWIERPAALLRKVPGSTFAYHYVRVVKNEPAIEIGEAQEGLNVLYLPGFRPVADSFDFL
ncbi:hypothetical protein M404DRAFT_162179, partial [Pisolithus tinctorius Marx 270]